jgi:hypothetical protein
LLSYISEKYAIGLIALLVVAICDVLCDSVVVLWVVAAYMKFVVVSVARIKLGAVFVVYVRLVVEIVT